MKKFIFTERNGIYIIDITKTLELINKACNVIREVAATGKPILYVGTKPQAATIIKEEAERCGQFYIINRWLGGTLTNYRTIRQSIKRLEHLEKMVSDGTNQLLTKKEVLTNEKYMNKLQLMLGGIRKMNRIPGLLIVVDTKREYIAVKEANRLGIPVCAIIDTNCNPDPIDYPIPGNDDAIRSIKIILSRITDSVIEGLQMRVDEETAAKGSEGEMEEEPRLSVLDKVESVEVEDEIEGGTQIKKKDLEKVVAKEKEEIKKPPKRMESPKAQEPKKSQQKRSGSRQKDNQPSETPHADSQKDKTEKAVDSR